MRWPKASNNILWKPWKNLLRNIKEISKEEAEKFIGKTLDEEELMSLLKQ